MLPILINYLYVNKLGVVIANRFIAKKVCHKERRKDLNIYFKQKEELDRLVCV